MIPSIPSLPSTPDIYPVIVSQSQSFLSALPASYGFNRNGIATDDYLNGTILSYGIDEIRLNTSKGYYSEMLRTNAALRSQEFDNASWAKTRTTVTANTTVAPDGTTTADSILEDTNTQSHFVSQSFTPATGTIYTFSCYAKPLGRDWILFFFAAGGIVSTAYFDITNGVVGGLSNATAKITATGNGFYRCSMTTIATVSTAAGTFGPQCAFADGTISYTGVITKGLIAWGAQLEVGGFASSYIPTTTSGITRAQDCLILTDGNAVSNALGTIFMEITPDWTGTITAAKTLIDTRPSGGTDGLVLQVDTSLQLSVSWMGQTYTTAALTWTRGTLYKVAITWDTINLNLYQWTSGTPTTRLAQAATGYPLSGSSSSIYIGTGSTQPSTINLAGYVKRMTITQECLNATSLGAL